MSKKELEDNFQKAVKNIEDLTFQKERRKRHRVQFAIFLLFILFTSFFTVLSFIFSPLYFLSAILSIIIAFLLVEERNEERWKETDSKEKVEFMKSGIYKEMIELKYNAYTIFGVFFAILFGLLFVAFTIFGCPLELLFSSLFTFFIFKKISKRKDRLFDEM